MSPAPQLFRVNPVKKTSERIREADFAALGFQERRDIQEWIALNPTILGDDLLIIAKEYDKFDLTNERLDLLAVDGLGNLVIVELKRDDTGADVHWQSIKYASYVQHASAAEIVGMLADYTGASEEEAREKLLRHLGADDLDGLNRSQRIIIASHRFAREVTSAVLWLNERMNEDVITCVQLTPYQDGEALYVQANTIIPVPGTEGYRIVIGPHFSPPLRPNPDINDVRDTLQGIIHSVKGRLSDINRTERIHRGTQWGWWHLWYDREPWDDWSLCYNIVLRRKDRIADWLLAKKARDLAEGEWVAAIYLLTKGLPESLRAALHKDIEGLQVDAHVQKYSTWTLLFGVEELTDDFAEKFADMIRQYIELVTPLVDQAYEQGGFESGGEEEETEE